jgi:flagellar P-ring protein precursor FlgI
MRTNILATLSLLLLLTSLSWPADASASRIKDVARWEGVEENVVIGIGVVVGLQGTGDGGQTVRDYLRNAMGSLETDIDPRTLRPKNAALVTVTASLPAFSRKGNVIDITVSSMGDAKSLVGGTLLPTPLRDMEGRAVWAVAQGSLTIGGFSAAAGGAKAAKNHTTVGRVPGGGKVVRGIAPDVLNRAMLRLSLREADFKTAVGASRTINAKLLGDFAHAVDSGTIEINVPPQYQGRVPELVARLEILDIVVDGPARVVVNERTGTVVMGSKVRIATVAVAHGGLTLEVDTRWGVSQPGPFSKGQTTTTANSSVAVSEESPELQVLEGVSIGEVVGALNQLGVAPRDLISILQAIRAAGALDADLEVL